MGRIVAVLSGKGGVGKTTVVLNAGVALAQNYGKKVTIVDCNMTTSHLGIALGMHQAPVTLNTVLRGEATVEEALYRHNSGMLVLPSSLKLRDMDGVDMMRLKPLVRKLADQNDLLLLDAGPGLGREALSAVHSASEVIFVATPTLPAIMDVLRYNEFLRDHEKRHLGLILNMVAKNESQMNHADIEQMLGLPIVTSIPRDAAIPRALAAEVPAVIAFPDSKGPKELFNVARHIAGLPMKKEIKVSTLDSLAEKTKSFMHKLSKFPALD